MPTNLPDTTHPVLLTVDETAELLTVPVATLRYWRHRGEGPRGFKVGRWVRYDRADVVAWLAEQRRRTA